MPEREPEPGSIAYAQEMIRRTLAAGAERNAAATLTAEEVRAGFERAKAGNLAERAKLADTMATLDADEIVLLSGLMVSLTDAAKMTKLGGGRVTEIAALVGVMANAAFHEALNTYTERKLRASGVL